MPYLGEMIPRLEFDTIYHEHLCYFSLTALDALFRRHGLAIADVEEIALHGGSLLLQVARVGRLEAEGGTETVCLALEVIENLAYERSRFLRGATR